MKCSLIFVLLLALSGPSWGASIGLFSDPNCSSCNLTIPSGQTGTLYISAVDIGGPSELCQGIDGAELRVVGLPPGWTSIAQPNPQAILTIGDPMQCGANIAFYPAQAGHCILLYTVTIHATSPIEGATLTVVAHCDPSHPQYVCPLIATDYGVAYARCCVPGGTLFLNSSQECSVAVQPSTWSGVKTLFN
jgi:hypothetical protein